VKRRALALLVVAVLAVVSVVIAIRLSRPSGRVGEPIQASLADIVRIRTEPFPEGTPAPPFTQAPATAPFFPLDLVRDMIPIPLPAPLKQGDCAGGERLIIELGDGRAITYGPCRYPTSIELLRAGMQSVISTYSRQVWEMAGIGLADIESVRIQPTGEGPGSPIFERKPSSRDSLSLDLIEDRIPIPLPLPLDQGGCTIGGNLIIEVVDGRTFVYGPCQRPSEIDLLWARIGEVQTNGACLPNCGPGKP
jgi:hypothetical protein